MPQGHRSKDVEAQLLVRTILWIIVGIVTIALVVWWVTT